MEWDLYSKCNIPSTFESFVVDKDKSSKNIFIYILARLQKMFEYKNVPETLDIHVLDRYLMLNGIACITEVDGLLYAFSGNLGDVQDIYYRPTKFIVSNPHLGSSGFFKNVTVLGDEPHDGVLMRNDTEWIGLMPLIGRYSYLMAENFITIRSADIMLRILALLTAPDDDTKKSADMYIEKLIKGEISCIGENRFLDGINMQSPPSNNGSYLTQFIELHQYLLGGLYNELGLKANYNMKREAIGTGESTMDDDVILPLCENMLMCRREDFAKVNEMYGTNIEVDFSSAWKSKRLLSSIEILDKASQLVSSSNISPCNVTEGNTPENNIPEDNTSENNTPKDNTSEDNTPEDNNSEDNIPDDNITDNKNRDNLDNIVNELVEDISDFITEKEINDENKCESEESNT